jgi:hypothetical protein
LYYYRRTIMTSFIFNFFVDGWHKIDIIFLGLRCIRTREPLTAEHKVKSYWCRRKSFPLVLEYLCVYIASMLSRSNLKMEISFKLFNTTGNNNHTIRYILSTADTCKMYFRYNVLEMLQKRFVFINFTTSITRPGA